MAGSGKAHLRPAGTALLTVEDLVVEFPVGRSGLKVNAVSGISFDVMEGETLGLVGESGCGKSTTGKAIMQIPAPTSGSVMLDGVELTEFSSRPKRNRKWSVAAGVGSAASNGATLGSSPTRLDTVDLNAVARFISRRRQGERLRKLRPKMQMIFQDPISSLNPRRKVVDIVREPLDIWNKGTPAEQEAQVRKVLETVGIDPDQAGTRKPHEFSGGQCQRICIARAVVLEPKVIICDEPVSALDVSIQAQILNLLEDMKKEYGLTLIFIAHDLAVVKNVSDRVVVMYLGKVCEVGPPDALYADPAHHYTKALIDSIPEPDPTVRPDASAALEGDVPSPVFPPSGCRFRTRCPVATEKCSTDEPILREVSPGSNHFVACHFPRAVGSFAASAAIWSDTK